MKNLTSRECFFISVILLLVGTIFVLSGCLSAKEYRMGQAQVRAELEAIHSEVKQRQIMIMKENLIPPTTNYFYNLDERLWHAIPPTLNKATR